DWKITVLAGNRAWDDATKTYPNDEHYAGLRIIRVNRPAVRRNILARALGFAMLHQGMLRAAKAIGPIDLVIGTTAPPQGGILAVRIAHAKKCPFIYKVLDLYPDVATTLGRLRERSFIHRRWLNWDTQAMQSAAAVVTISKPMTDRIARLRGINPNKLRTIHDGYDPARITSPRENSFRRQHVPKGKFVVQYAGNMGLSHPFETILAAARLLADSQPDILFQFIGDGPNRGQLDKNAPKNVSRIPFQPADRLGEVLATADLGLICQEEKMYDQALPYKIYALLAAGKPCIFIGSDQSEIARWLLTAGAGRVISQGDAKGLAGAIVDLRQSKQRDVMAQAARQLFEARFNSIRAAESWRDLIAETLKS
ncbi:MAG TPA: glycosyltransferase family 4 protein, partial [Phycisphaerae bacterium]|nr:glycosyltransferase family 4 protein [Phycisphaerae bacterium]